MKVVFGGGLGNQMFLYAYIYSQIKNQNLNNNIDAIMHRNKNEDKRDFALKTLNCSINMNVVDEQNVDFKTKLKINLKKQIFRILNKTGFSNDKKNEFLKKFNIINPPELFKYYPKLILNKKSFVEGAFQSWKYFDKYKENIKKEFKVTKEISEENKKVLEKINSCNSVCVHIRRGDYVNSFYSKVLQVCDYDYYKNGMDYIASKVKNPVFYVFSNSHEDHEWIRENYKFDYKIIHVDLDNPDYEELRLMYSCKHFIISNSTFSWWAQYLSENDNKCVVAPSKWYLGEDDDSDIYMPEWKIINVGEKYGSKKH